MLCLRVLLPLAQRQTRPLTTSPMASILSPLAKRQTRPLTTSPMTSILQHTEYSEMKALLQAEATLGPLDSASLHILHQDIQVNQRVLNLNALAMNSWQAMGENYEGTKDLKRSKCIKLGSFSVSCDQGISRQYDLLADQAGFGKAELNKELFETNQHRKFLLQRQLVGFYLVQGLEDGHRRLPMEAVARLANLLFARAFTAEEDLTILAWVEEQGASGWAELARSLGRTYPSAGTMVKRRHKYLREQRSLTTGAYSLEELEQMVELIVQQSQAALEDTKAKGEVDFNVIAAKMNRGWNSVFKCYTNSLLPVVRRHLASTLEEDVREAMIHQVRERGWRLVAEVDMSLLVDQEEFRGHTATSLAILYDSMLGNTMAKEKLKGKTLVTVEQVEEWWSSTHRRAKSNSLREKEEAIVEAYLRAMENHDTIDSDYDQGSLIIIV